MRDEWRVVPLGDVCDLAKGTSATLKTPPGPYPLIVTGAEASSAASYQFDSEAVCVPLVSSTGHGHASLKRVHYASGRFAVANIVAACTPKPGAGVDMRWLWLYLNHRRNDLIVTRMKGTANVSLSLGALAGVPVDLPPRSEQRRIVHVVEALDQTTSSAATLHDSAARLYRSWGRRLQSNDSVARPLGDLVGVARAGGTPSRKRAESFGGSIPWVKSGEVGGEAIRDTQEHITEAALAASSAWLVPSGAVLVAMYGATAGQVGRLQVQAATNQAVLALVPDPAAVDANYLYHLLRSDGERLKSLATGAAQPNLSKGVIVAQEYRVPSLELQVELGREMDAMAEVRRAAAAEVMALRDLRSNLLTALISGAHQIPDSYDDLLAG